jgi:GTP pyrophosphokinase
MGLGLRNSVKALTFMLNHQITQERDDGKPYYTHPVKVAAHIIALRLFHDNLEVLDNVIAAAILHDVVEDTEVTYTDIKNEFNEAIADLVQLLTKTKGGDLRVYYENIKNNIFAAVIKLSDRCHNISTAAGTFTRARLEKYVKETYDFVIPLARYTRDNNPDISEAVVVMSYHIKSVTHAIEIMIPLMIDDVHE